MTREYRELLDAALAQGMIAERNSVDFLSGGSDLLCETCALYPYSRIGWDGSDFAVLDKKENRRIVISK